MSHQVMSQPATGMLADQHAGCAHADGTGGGSNTGSDGLGPCSTAGSPSRSDTGRRLGDDLGDLFQEAENNPGNPEYELGGGNPDSELTDGNPACELPNGLDEGNAKEAGMQQRPQTRLLHLLCLVGGLEGADSVLLPCVFLALQSDLGITLKQLAMMSLVQGLSGNLAAPLWGMLADRGMLRRKTIIVVGCVFQGLITMALGTVDNMHPMLVLRALNGAFLASLRPIVNGIVADITAEANRGKVYGAVGMAMYVGAMVGTIVGTNLARKTIVGLQGWRAAFLIVGAASALVGLVAGLAIEEPARLQRKVSGTYARGCGWAAFRAEFREVSKCFRMPSFCVLILQGCFGTVPWNALGYKTMFFQLSGMTDQHASLIDVFSQIAGALGGLLGGLIGDGLSRCTRNHGRPLTAQTSVLLGIPLVWLIFMTKPPEGAAFTYYAVLMVALGLTATWCGNGVNLPILSQLVEEDRRATILAWEGTLESSCSVVFGNAMVGLLAENVFGYDLSSVQGAAADPSNSRALGMALALVSFFPWMLCFACYSLLHWTYPRDLKWLREQELIKRDLRSAKGGKPLATVGMSQPCPNVQVATSAMPV